ncbi:EAL and HDOD domain-containing protein [Marinomonas pollencensis]|uniref:EAL and modified HD-GYP domain-containing signal transduction protein n=1 Tax=Marinomonas pollencensis TaxID=491954 RepID=A0A3E0DRC1_9GAMM|nr:HDOD domain-containing protein [Marinomonas pollencensis]REG85685.1 EAL and modified HD-GYP domain-containing signal transduction protein [Marinomonas pollencensis]
MISNNYLFSRQAVVDSKMTAKANNLFHLNNMEQEKKDSFLSLLFTDLSIVDAIKHQPIFIAVSIHEVEHLPTPPSSMRFVLFFDAAELRPERDNDRLSELRLDGYQLGLTNFSLKFFGTPFFDYFSFVELSLNKFDMSQVLNVDRHQGLAHKEVWVSHIQSQEQHQEIDAKTHASWFSGDFLSASVPVKGNNVPGYRLILIDLLKRLQDGRSSIRDISATIEKDVTLAYRVLKLTKSVMYHRQFNVHNVQRAIEIIGIKDLIKWVTLAMFSSIDGKPDCLFSMAVNRAAFCNGIAKAMYPKLEGAFLVGLFSYLPSFFDASMDEILHDLPLDESLVSALKYHQGHLGSVLSVAKHYEAGHWEKIPFDELAEQDLSSNQLRQIYIDSLKAAKEIYQI